MLHLCGFYQSQDQGAAYAQMNALADQALTITGGTDLVVPALSQIVALAAGLALGGNGNARLESPSVRGITRVFVEPVMGGLDADALPTSPHVLHDYRKDPLPLKTNEHLICFSHADPTVARRQWVLIWLADKAIDEVNAPTYTARAVGTTTLTAGAWTAGTIVFDDPLPAQRWAVVGIRARSANLVAARLIFPGQPWRPGVLGCQARTDLHAPAERFGGFGNLGTFDLESVPQVEYLANVADTAETVYLDLIPA